MLFVAVVVCAWAAAAITPVWAQAIPQTSVNIVDDNVSSSMLQIYGDQFANHVVITFDRGLTNLPGDDSVNVRETSATGVVNTNVSSTTCFHPAADPGSVTCSLPDGSGVEHAVTQWLVDGQSGDDDIRLAGFAHGTDRPLAGQDYLVTEYGGPGNDVLYGSNGIELICGDGGQASSRVDAVCGAAGPVNAPDGTNIDGNDEIHDGLGFRLADGTTDSIYGGDGDDTVVQSAIVSGTAHDDQDYLDLGAGIDTVSYAARDADHSVTIHLNDTTNFQDDDGSAGEQDALGPDIERVIGSAGADLFLGTSSQASAVTFDGGPGDDIAHSGTHDETFVGGSGTDTVTYADDPAAGPAGVSADGITGDGPAGESDNVATDVERLVGTSSGDDLTGAPVAGCIVAGGDGDDVLRSPAMVGCTLQGGDGSDTLVGGSGPDTIEPGASSTSAPGDQIAFGGGIDTADYSTIGIVSGGTVAQVTAAA
ncbi:MAG: hypothetical protein JWN41_1663, partial [Thermoleophilia bacterium]|nr:hypothetical protein [Thermoleophilia bacterium]